MADYAFYTDIYYGSLIPEKAFPEMAQRAGEYLACLQRNYRVSADGRDCLNMAICAIAESLYAHSKRRGGITAAAVGEASVHYMAARDGDRQLCRELYEKASIYLQICRGVEA
jgi:hypothetical protein